MVVSILSRQECCILTTTLSVLFRSYTPLKVVEHAVSNLALIKVHTYRFPITLSMHLTQSTGVSQINALQLSSYGRTKAIIGYWSGM